MYYSSLKNTCNKWLDLYALCSSFLKNNQKLVCVKYFSALVSSPPNDQNKTNRQKLYLDAISTNHKVKIELGFLTLTKLKCHQPQIGIIRKLNY